MAKIFLPNLLLKNKFDTQITSIGVLINEI